MFLLVLLLELQLLEYQLLEYQLLEFLVQLVPVQQMVLLFQV